MDRGEAGVRGAGRGQHRLELGHGPDDLPAQELQLHLHGAVPGVDRRLAPLRLVPAHVMDAHPQRGGLAQQDVGQRCLRGGAADDGHQPPGAALLHQLWRHLDVERPSGEEQLADGSEELRAHVVEVRLQDDPALGGGGRRGKPGPEPEAEDVWPRRLHGSRAAADSLETHGGLLEPGEHRHQGGPGGGDQLVPRTEWSDRGACGCEEGEGRRRRSREGAVPPIRDLRG